MMDGPMDGQMEDQMVLLQNMSTDWGNWMQSVDAQEVVVEVEGVGTRAAVTSRVRSGPVAFCVAPSGPRMRCPLSWSVRPCACGRSWPTPVVEPGSGRHCP